MVFGSIQSAAYKDPSSYNGVVLPISYNTHTITGWFFNLGESSIKLLVGQAEEALCLKMAVDLLGSLPAIPTLCIMNQLLERPVIDLIRHR